MKYFSTNLGNINMNTETKPKLKIVNHESNVLPYYDIPFCTIKKSKFDKVENEKIIKVQTKVFGYSAYKLNNACKLVRNKSLYNALDYVNSNNSKGTQKIKETLTGFIKNLDKEKKSREENGIVKDIDNHYTEWRVAEAYVGKKKGMVIPHQRAKGRMVTITKQKARLNLVLKRVDGVDAMEKVAIGKADASFAFNVRQFLFVKNATLSELRSMSFITTSKGRKYRNMQFNRMVTYLREKIHKKYGKLLSREVIESQLRKELAFTLDLNNPKSEYNSVARFANLTPSEKLKVITTPVEQEAKDNPVDKDYKEREEMFNKKVRKL